MTGRDIWTRLRQLDAYPKTLEDFRIKTFSGATGGALMNYSWCWWIHNNFWLFLLRSKQVKCMWKAWDSSNLSVCICLQWQSSVAWSCLFYLCRSWTTTWQKTCSKNYLLTPVAGRNWRSTSTSRWWKSVACVSTFLIQMFWFCFVLILNDWKSVIFANSICIWCHKLVIKMLVQFFCTKGCRCEINLYL